MANKPDGTDGALLKVRLGGGAVCLQTVKVRGQGGGV